MVDDKNNPLEIGEKGSRIEKERKRNNKLGLRNVNLIELNSLNRNDRRAVVMDLTNIKMCKNKQFYCVLTMNWRIFRAILSLRANFNKLHLTHEPKETFIERLFNTLKKEANVDRKNKAKGRET